MNMQHRTAQLPVRRMVYLAMVLLMAAVLVGCRREDPDATGPLKQGTAPPPPAVTAAAKPVRGLVQNGAFADGMSNWTWWMEAQKNNSLIEATKGMLRIHNPSGVLAGVRQTMTVESGAVYRLTGVVRSVLTNDARKAFGARIAFFLPPQQEQHVVWMREYDRWLSQSVVFTNTVAGVATVYAHLGFGSIATTGEFSSIGLEKVEGIPEQ